MSCPDFVRFCLRNADIRSWLVYHSDCRDVMDVADTTGSVGGVEGTRGLQWSPADEEVIARSDVARDIVTEEGAVGANKRGTWRANSRWFCDAVYCD